MTAAQRPKELRREEERFKLIARATDDVFWDWDIETNKAWRSEGASEHFGYPPDEQDSTVDFWVNRIHPEDRDRVRSTIDAAVREGKEFWREEYRFLCKDGSYAYVLDRGYVVHNAEGKPIRMVGALADITQQRHLERKLVEERNLLRALIDNYPDSVYMKDQACRKTLANKANFRNMGFESEAEILGKTDFDHYTPEVAAQLFANDQQVLQGVPMIEQEEKLVTASGKVYWMLTSKVPLRDGNGKICGIIGGGRNITRQKEAELKLTAERNLLRTVIDNLPDCIYVKDRQSRKVMANSADLVNLGMEREAEVLGRTDFDFFPPEIAAAFLADDQVVLDAGRPVVNREEKVVRPSGEIRWLLTTKIPWRDENGKIIGLVGIGRDITEKRRLEEQLLRAQRVESIGRLATGVAHDLNNILAPILISTGLLKSKIHDKQGVEMLTCLESSAQRAADILKQILGFSRGLDGQRIHLNPQLLVQETLQTIRPSLNPSIEVRTDFAPDARSISGDPAQLPQALLNLCVNALEAMPKGGQLSLKVRNYTADANFATLDPGARQTTYVLVEVTDTGHGVVPEIRDRIFDPFFTTKELGKGMGMGLSMALSIVRSHDGFILMESSPGKGSSFQVYLPAT